MSVRTIASSLPLGNFVTGTYTGDGAATQAIVGVGFQPRFLIVFKNVTTTLGDMGMKSEVDGNNTKLFWLPTAAWYYQVDHIISLDANGFTVGDGTGSANSFNINLMSYTYIAYG